MQNYFDKAKQSKYILSTAILSLDEKIKTV